MVNATGWSELMDANLIGAAYTMYDAAFAGWIVAILFFVYQLMLLIKTRNLPLAFITGIFFASLYAVSVFVKPISIQVIFILLVFELAGILYLWIWK
jgi:hypothetical protein